MNNFSKLTAIFFALMLSYVSIIKVNYENSHPATFRNAGDERPSSYLSETPLQDVFCLQRQIEQVVNPVSHFPAPNTHLKDHPTVFAESFLSIELRIQSIDAQYLSHAIEIQRSLTIGDIIFPFHYFW